MTRPVRVPALDGIRGLAILAVLVGHGLGPTGNHLAIAGVTAFFVLSGYLITGRLLTGQTLRRFYTNRARRLLPAMLVMLAITGSFFISIGLPAWKVAEAGFYVRDITVAHLDAPFTPWEPMWSLAVEEQFYLLWPLAFGLLATTARRSRVVVAVGMCSVVGMLVAFAAGDVELARFSPLTQAWTLCAGCWLALRGSDPQWPAWLGSPVLAWFGDRSYGIYLWHYPLMIGLMLYLPERVALTLGCLAAVAVAAVSWRYVESPWLGRSGAVRRRPAETSGQIRHASS